MRTTPGPPRRPGSHASTWSYPSPSERPYPSEPPARLRRFPRPLGRVEFAYESGVTEIPVISSEAVFAAVNPATAVERTRIAFERHARGEWTMPAKVYLDSPPYGDFRAMPALGDGL